MSDGTRAPDETGPALRALAAANGVQLDDERLPGLERLRRAYLQAVETLDGLGAALQEAEPAPRLHLDRWGAAPPQEHGGGNGDADGAGGERLGA